MAASLVRKAYLDTTFGQLHYCYSNPLTAGQSQPIPILLLHMSASSSLSFHALMRCLSSTGYTCFAPDMPGFGASSDPPIDPPNIEWYAEFYHTIFSALPGFENGCHLVGHHSGGVIGIELANSTRYGDFVQSLTCVGPTVMTEEQRRDMEKTFLEPFNKPVPTGEHLFKTWEYLQWEGLSPTKNIELLQRETLDHIRAWRGDLQLCVGV